MIISLDAIVVVAGKNCKKNTTVVGTKLVTGREEKEIGNNGVVGTSS